MRANTKILISILAWVVLALIALWRISDVVRGESGLEDLVLSVPLLISSVGCAVFMARRLRRGGPEVQVLPPLEPAAAGQKIWRIAKWTTGIVSLFVVLYTSIWALRSGTLLTPVLVGGVTLGASWTAIAMFFRRKARR